MEYAENFVVSFKSCVWKASKPQTKNKISESDQK